MSNNANVYTTQAKVIHGAFIAVMIVVSLMTPYWVFGLVPFFTSPDMEVLERSTDATILPEGYALTWASAEEEAQAIDDFNWCRNCHSLKEGEKHRTGPNLYQILGQPYANQPQFYYSAPFKALRDEGAIWTYEALDAFIKNPGAEVPGTRMRYPPAIFENMQNDDARARAMKYMLINTQ